MDEQQRKAMLKETFDTVSGGYDGGSLRFFPHSAQNMVSLLDLRGDEHALDVACGTGHASLAVAQKLSRGRVTGVDFSVGMLDQARSKAAARQISNVDFLERDMTALGFAADSFDVALCAFGDDAQGWWDLVRNAGFRRLIGQLPLNDRERFKREHLKEIEALRTKDGIWLDVGVLYTVGTKPI